ncbi:hypothetical protein DPMN_179188 [Dreissena polymorpha]|uniref:Uncharacterized protein n=1 Tax=Dreissena polymorpha TaxID=45954 RepID=A0A9D4IKJ6_DREPO|nr:hypothetical protein DPMN_179188 [Dreissena polymorpha]
MVDDRLQPSLQLTLPSERSIGNVFRGVPVEFTSSSVTFGIAFTSPTSVTSVTLSTFESTSIYLTSVTAVVSGGTTFDVPLKPVC